MRRYDEVNEVNEMEYLNRMNDVAKVDEVIA